MNLDDSITRWIDALKQRNSEAAQRLWESYFQKMVALAGRMLAGAPRAVADEEDVALSAFKSFCQGLQAGRFTRIEDRTNLWPLLVGITANKAKQQMRHENRRKRGGSGRAVSGDPSVDNPRTDRIGLDIGELLGSEPEPEFAVQMADELEHLLDRLDRTGDSSLRQVALRRIEGFSIEEIADSLGCVRRTVERKLLSIRNIWCRDDS